MWMNPLITFCSLLFFLFCLQTPSLLQAGGTPLDSYLEEAFKSSEEIKAIELDILSLQSEIGARELELSPAIAVKVIRFWDNRPSLSSSRQSAGFLTEVELSKPLSTGTTFNLLSGIETAEYHPTPEEEQDLLNWRLGVTQSLWQNSFGRQTALRRQRDQEEIRSRLLALILERQEIVVEFELLYWDIAYAQQEVKIREENLERSRLILSWIRKRIERYAAEQVDLLQGQALVSSRELQLQLASDNLRTLQARLNEKVPLKSEFVPHYEELKTDRKLLSLPADIDFAPSIPVLIETLKAQAEADFLEMKSELESDQLKPILEIGYAYGQQGLSTSFSTAGRDAFSTNNNYHEMGVVFTTPLDFSLIRKSRQATQAAAQAQTMRSVMSRRQSGIQWEDLERTIREQRQRVETARTLADFQHEKSREERIRYEKGRTTAFQAISFEQEAAESELLVLQLQAQLRRTEARARVYIQKGDSGE